MKLADLIEFCKAKGDDAYMGMIVRDYGVMLTRPSKEGRHTINYFGHEKDAKAYCYHLYGKSAWECKKDGIEIVGMKNYTPTPGDFVLYDGSGSYDAMAYINTDSYTGVHLPDHYKGGYGYLCGEFNKPTPERMPLLFNAYGCGRSEDGAGGSGGPVPQIETAELTLIGLTLRNYDRWSEGIPQANSTGYWTMTVPVWRWTGNWKNKTD
jgi:hypothetical protein